MTVRRPTASYEREIVLLALLTGLPALLASVVLLWVGRYPPVVQVTLAMALAGASLVAAIHLRHRVVRPLRTLANMLGALREGDYSMRASSAHEGDVMGLAFLESNLLAETLHSQRLGAMEATALVRAVMAEIDVVVVALDAHNRIRLVNRAGQRFFTRSQEYLLGRSADEVGLGPYLTGPVPRPVDVTLPGGAGRWEVRRVCFRQDGRPHTLLVLADLTRALREQELQAWRRLVRVLSHEINNSLAPIKSISASLLTLLERQDRADTYDDVCRGLSVIGGRADALVRFMSAYARLARLPAPALAGVDVHTWVRRASALDTRIPVHIHEGPTTLLEADGDQLDQLLINLLRNAIDAALETDGRVDVRWRRQAGTFILTVEDEGPGLAGTVNLFVPFYTTKPTGSGIGLVLCEQIAKAHGGALSLENRADRAGCIATFRLATGD